MSATPSGKQVPRPRILLVDDDASYCNVIATRLGAEGFDVVSVASGPQALEWLATHTADLILLDVLMPEQGGWAVYRQIRARPNAKTTPIILLTVIAPERQWEPVLDPGETCAFLMGKPLAHALLVERIRSLLPQRA